MTVLTVRMATAAADEVIMTIVISPRLTLRVQRSTAEMTVTTPSEIITVPILTLPRNRCGVEKWIK